MSDILKIGLLLRDIGPITGRKKLQKIVYVLQASGVDFRTHYALSLGDPYSSELKDSLDELIEAHLIEEKSQGDDNFEYSVTVAFLSVLKEAATDQPVAWSHVARELNSRDVGELEGISTILFLQSRGWSESDIGGRFKSLKPQLSDRFEHFLGSGREFRKKTSIPVSE